MAPSLTKHLLQLDEPTLKNTTTHPFLEAAATNSLPIEKLKHWLAQDRLYALSYVNFIGSLLSKISIPTSPNREESLEWRIASCLMDALTNIRTELKMFEDTARAEGFFDEICDVEPERPTRCYQDLFAGAIAQARPLIVGMVVLWGTEECYLRAWRFAKQKRVVVEGSGDVMQRVFIPNWSSGEFEGFVRGIGGLVDEMAAGVEQGSALWRECEATWRQVVWAEAEFWPHVEETGEELRIRSKL